MTRLVSCLLAAVACVAVLASPSQAQGPRLEIQATLRLALLADFPLLPTPPAYGTRPAVAEPEVVEARVPELAPTAAVLELSAGELRAQRSADKRLGRILLGPVAAVIGSAAMAIGPALAMVGTIAACDPEKVQATLSGEDKSGGNDGVGGIFGADNIGPAKPGASQGCMIAIYSELGAVIAGAIVGMPLGVHVAGGLLDGMGNFGAGLLGAGAGTALAAGMIVAAAATDEPLWAFMSPAPIIIGAIVGYELLSLSRESDARRGAEASGAVAMPVAMPLTYGGRLAGGSIGMAMTF